MNQWLGVNARESVDEIECGVLKRQKECIKHRERIYMLKRE